MKKIMNLTPHEIKIISGDAIKRIPSVGIARVDEKVEIVGDINGIPLIEKYYSNITGLPDQRDGVTLIVSLIVLQNSNRSDLVCPDTGLNSVVRGVNGEIKGVKRFQCRPTAAYENMQTVCDEDGNIT